MEPQYSFCTSADGTRIAYAVYGSGPPLLYFPGPQLGMDARFSLPEARAYFDALAARALLVTFDRRGTGASTRDVDDRSTDAEACDVEAVADAAGLRSFALFAETMYEAIGAVRLRQRIDRLVLWCPSAIMEFHEAARTYRENWSYARRVLVGIFFPDGPVTLQRAYSQAMKDSVSAETAAMFMEAQAGVDWDALWPTLTAPALVLGREYVTALKQDILRVTGLLPNGQLRFLSGRIFGPYPGHEPVVDAVFEFMGLNDPAVASAKPTSLPPGMTAILFLDIAGSTELTTRLGDDAYRERERALDTELRKAIRDAGGAPVEGKVLGDGIMAVFTAARQAIDAALACRELGDAAGLPLHLGIHAGDVVREGNNVHGGAVQVASRVQGAAAPGEILVSQTVRDLARTSAGVAFEDRGEHALKGIDEPQRLFAVRDE